MGEMMQSREAITRIGIARVGDLVVLDHGSQSPREKEWIECVAMVAAQIESRGEVDILVRSTGGGPNASQRGDLNDCIGEKPARMAFLTESQTVRGIAVAFSWTGKMDVRVFEPHQMKAALAHLRTQATADEVAKTLHRLGARA